MVSKKLSIIMMVICVGVACNTSKQRIKYDKLDIRNKYQLNYNLASGGERYQFIVDVMEFEPFRKFQFTMTNNNQTLDIITLSPKALDSANALKNRFSPYFRADTLADNLSTVWFSKTMFNELSRGDTSVFDGDFSWRHSPAKFYSKGLVPFSYELNGVPQTVEALEVVEATYDNAKKYWVLNNPDNPLILRMDIGWVISLKEINHNYD